MVPTLYFAQGIPYFIVNNISVLMFAKMGVPNGDMALLPACCIYPGLSNPSGARLWTSSRPKDGGLFPCRY